MVEGGRYFRFEKDGFVGLLALNRPERRNTMPIEFFTELKRVFGEIDEDEETRVVLLYGEGKSFTAGLDLTEAAST